MAVKRLAREREPVEFKPLPGQENDWASGSEPEILSPLWRWLGLYPILLFITLYCLLIGMA